jgi:hypothetical protein
VMSLHCSGKSLKPDQLQTPLCASQKRILKEWKLKQMIPRKTEEHESNLYFHLFD